MSKKEIFDYFYTNSTNLKVENILGIMLAGLAIAFIIYITYWVTYRGVSYNRKFNVSLVVLSLISIVIMLMISSNIVISLGMVGALSIVRFRTPIKDSRDTVFIFWAITEGLSIGSQNFKLAIITTLFISIIILLFNFVPKFFNKYLIVITGEKEIIDTIYLMETLKNYVLDSKLKTANRDGDHQEMIFEVRTKGELNINVIKDLLKIKGIKSVNYVIESGETIG